MRRAGHRVVLNDVDVGTLVVVADSGVHRRPHRQAVAYLKRVTQTDATGPVWRQLKATCRELRRLPPKIYVRGKFEAWCFVQLVERILAGMSNVAREAGGSISIAAPLSEGTLIQLLSTGTATPPSLDAFLRFHLARGATGAGANAPVLRRSLAARLLSRFRRP
jgi:hypothetical protein